jgi:hypothetical protein
MNERARLLEKLVVERLVNVAERMTLGMVTRDEVSNVLKSLVLQHGAFSIRPRGNTDYEGATITSDPSGLKITWERAYPLDPTTVAQRRVEVFVEIDAAIETFIDSEWSAGIDGIAVISRE